VGRSRWGASLLATAALVAAGVLLAVALRSRSDSHAAVSAVARLGAATHPSAEDRALARAPRTVSHSRPSDRLRDPLQSPVLRSYLAARSGAVSVAVLDLKSGQKWIYRPGERAVTASIVKVDILETLLEHAQAEHEPPSSVDADVATGMIEDSDNDDATELWDSDDGSTGIGAYNEKAGLHQTELNTGGYWGLSTTSASDQVQLLRQLVRRHGLLDGASRRYQLGLMESVTPDQDWGVSAGVPSGVKVALKNGWLPNGDGWEINSIGYIHGDGRAYLIAVLTSGDPSEGYGIDTISQISSDVWHGLAPTHAQTEPTVE
jgi:beta-lactamase class A